MVSAGLFAAALQQIARDDPDRVVICAPEERETSITAAELWKRALAIRSELEASSLNDGAVLLWMGGNASGFYSLLPACMQAGTVLILADQTMPAALIDDVESYFGVAGRIVRSNAVADAFGVALPGDLHVIPSAHHERRRWPDASIIKLTSGSSGVPRGVKATEAHLWDDVHRIVEAMGIRDTDMQLASIPLTHSYGLGNLVLPSLVLGTRVVIRSPGRPATFAEDAQQYGVTVYPATPHIYDYLLAQCRDAFPQSLRLLISAGAPLSRFTAQRALDTWGLKIHSFYGSTESGGIAYDASTEVQNEGCVGTPLPRTTIELRPEDGADPGTGRIFVRSGSVAAGYIAADGTNGSGAFSDGGFLTGDIGTLMPDRRLRLVGRVGTVINVGGLKVDPREVESVVSAAPGVTEALVIGVPCPSHGEDVVAVVAAPEGVHCQHLEAFCRTRLTRHRIPRRFVILDRLPVNSRGKVDRTEIRRRLADQACDQQRLA